MRIDAKCKLEKVASRNITRANLTAPWLDVEKKVAVATNGAAMAVVPVEIDKNEVAHSGRLPIAGLQASRKVKGLPGCFTCPNGTMDIIYGGGSFPRGNCPFMQWEQIIPTEQGKLRLVIDPKLLLDLAEAIGSPECVTLDMSPSETGLIVDCIGVNVHRRAVGGAYGVIMPRRA